MYLSFYGAAHEVTGSCFYLEACGKNILIDSIIEVDNSPVKITDRIVVKNFDNKEVKLEKLSLFQF